MSANYRRTLITAALTRPAAIVAVHSEHDDAACCATGRVVSVRRNDVMLIPGRDSQPQSIPIESITSVDILENATETLLLALRADIDAFIAQNAEPARG